MLILSDFSKTFTRSDMPTTWSVFAKSGILGEAYIADRDALYAANIGYETSGDIEMTEKWFLDHARLFAQYHLTQEQINTIVMDDRYFAPRDGVREFLDSITRADIPLVIVTSGVSDFVMAWFRERYDYTPETVFGNELIMEDGVVIGVDGDSAICPLDKSIDIEFEHGGDDIIILGDGSEDVAMAPTAKMSIGFTDEDRGFTVKLGKEASMAAVIPYLG